MINSRETETISTNNCLKENEENIRLIWFDDKTSIYSEIESKLLRLNPIGKFFQDLEELFSFIKLIINEKIFLIISSENHLSNILSKIDSFQSIIQIFILINEENKFLINEYSKSTIHIYTNKDELIKSIEEKLHHIERHLLFSFDLFNQKQKSTRDLSKESASFLWNQMLIHILKQIPQNDLAKIEMLNKCSDYYQTNEYELNKIEEFRNNYTRDKAILWYTDECFLYKLVNRALRTEDIQLIYSFRFFIIDLCFELEKEKMKLINEGIIKLYRGQILSNEEFKKLENNLGNFISTNGFLSTSRDINISISFTKIFDKKISKNVLFEINVDPSIESIIFADISSLGSMPHEQEVLFSLNSLFKIEKISFNSTLNLHIIEMTATNQGYEQIKQYIKWIQIELDYNSPLIYFGRLLWKELSQIDKALNYFQILFKSMSNDDPNISSLYTEIGNIYHEKGEYDLSLENYEKALNIRQKEIPLNHILIASSLNNIAIVYQQKSLFNQALEYLQQSLQLFEEYYPDNDNILQKSNTLSNMASIFREQGDLDKSLEYSIKSYNIRCYLLPNDHPLIADSLSNIGSIYYDQLKLDQALNYYKKALDIQDKTSPDDHLNKANTIRNIGLIYKDYQQWNQALDYFNKTLQMRIKILSNNNHPDIAICYGDIANIYENLNQNELAFDYYNRQLDIEEKFYSFDHPILILHFDLVLNILIKLNQLNKAIELCQQKIEFLENHYSYYAHLLISFAYLHENINQDQARIFYQKALQIFENKNDKQSIEKCLRKMIDFYSKLNLFEYILKYQLQLLEILSSDNQQKGYISINIAKLYQSNNQIDQALIYYRLSLQNFQSDHQQIQYIQQQILSIDKNNHSLNTVEEQNLSTTISNSDIRNKPKMTHSYAGKPAIKPATSAACILF